MKISIRKQKNATGKLNADDVRFASVCVINYLNESVGEYVRYTENNDDTKMMCDIYSTKTTISVICK